eukprot:6587130-Prymnesium_polylepis.1
MYGVVILVIHPPKSGAKRRITRPVRKDNPNVGICLLLAYNTSSRKRNRESWTVGETVIRVWSTRRRTHDGSSDT